MATKKKTYAEIVAHGCISDTRAELGMGTLLGWHGVGHKIRRGLVMARLVDRLVLGNEESDMDTFEAAARAVDAALRIEEEFYTGKKS